MSNETSNIPVRRKTSALSEFSVLSAGILAAVIVLAAVAVFAYIFMMRPPEKTAVVEDKAHLLTQSEENRISDLAEDLSSRKQINVVVVTTEDKGNLYAQDDSGSERFAADKYVELTKFQSYKDNSGVLILIDMENRYVYIYTYATAHAAITNSECVEMTDSVVPALKSEQYSKALESLIGQISDNDFFSGALVMVYALYIAGPLAIVALVLFIVSRRKRSKISTNYTTYMDLVNTKDTGDQDLFDHKTVTVTTTSSSSGGGGFGGGGGGGGGGHSGGGGSHF